MAIFKAVRELPTFFFKRAEFDFYPLWGHLCHLSEESSFCMELEGALCGLMLMSFLGWNLFCLKYQSPDIFTAAKQVKIPSFIYNCSVVFTLSVFTNNFQILQQKHTLQRSNSEWCLLGIICMILYIYIYSDPNLTLEKIVKYCDRHCLHKDCIWHGIS